MSVVIEMVCVDPCCYTPHGRPDRKGNGSVCGNDNPASGGRDVLPVVSQGQGVGSRFGKLGMPRKPTEPVAMVPVSETVEAALIVAPFTVGVVRVGLVSGA